jgi:hypothetical protein
LRLVIVYVYAFFRANILHCFSPAGMNDNCTGVMVCPSEEEFYIF